MEKRYNIKKQEEALLKDLGIDLMKQLRDYKTVEEWSKQVPILVCVKPVRDGNLQLGGEQLLKLSKGSNVIMSLPYFLAAKRGKSENQENNRLFYLKPSKKKFKDYYVPYNGQNLDNKSLLIMRTGGIGDILFTQPIIKYIKEKYPTCRIVFATSVKYEKLFDCWPKGLVDQWIFMPFGRQTMIDTYAHISLEGLIERCKESEKINVYDLFCKAFKLDINFETQKEYLPELIPEETDIQKYRLIVPANSVVFQHRSTSPLRSLNTKEHVALVNEILKTGKNIIFLDEPKLEYLYDIVISKCENKEKVFNFCKYSESIKDAIAIISLTDGVIGVDSSFIHIAAALKKKVLGIYGAFRAELRMKYYENSDYIQLDTCTCPNFPCFYHGQDSDYCPSYSSRLPIACMNQIDNELIMDKFKKLFL